MRISKKHLWWLPLGTLLCGATHATGLQIDWGNLHAELGGRFTAGATWRMQERSWDIVGKLNVPGQTTLCQPDDCISLTGDPEPNARLIAAQGYFSGTNTDNGNLNYQRYDIVSATARLAPTLTLDWGRLFAKISGTFYYDPVNTGFEETHTNTLYQARHTARPRDLEAIYANGAKWGEAYLSVLLPIGARSWLLSAGNLVTRWGEANLTIHNTLNAFNPHDASVASMPGFQLDEVAKPVPAILLAGDLSPALSFEALYQLQWEKVTPDPAGSFFSTSDVAGGGEYFITGLGQFSEDPNREYTPPGLVGMISSATRTIYLQPDHNARDSGQYGIQLKYFAENLIDGTEIGLYLLRYHSRLPYFSAIAANNSCTRDAASNTFVEVFLVCQGFSGSLAGVSNPVGREPLPGDTAQGFLEYPEDVDMLGFSFNTNVGDWSISGEYAYRRNMPLQVHQTDILFAAFAPSFPADDIAIPVGIAGTAPFTLPGYQRALPSFLAPYRGFEQYDANQYIAGYVRRPVTQISLAGLRIIGPHNPLSADQIVLVIEAGASHISGMPQLNELQIDGHGDRTHYGPGADGTGDPQGQTDTARINPTQQTRGFATANAAGYRLLVRATYRNAFLGLDLFPTLVWFHDLRGISPVTVDNYVEGRKMSVMALDTEISDNLSSGIRYQVFTGAGNQNQRKDRDNLSLFIRWTF